MTRRRKRAPRRPHGYSHSQSMYNTGQLQSGCTEKTKASATLKTKVYNTRMHFVTMPPFF